MQLHLMTALCSLRGTNKQAQNEVFLAALVLFQGNLKH